MEFKIAKSYENLIDGTATTEIKLPKKTISIQTSEFQSITPKNLDTFLKELDAQFKEWNEGIESKIKN
ncbi:hypothetical protein [Candidatus Lokiarchaeum ossiferum]|uniref:hypothetical protein n=1 Tax=Candidatus Lokiarchaeum ossiferum TaxID=2951803 RepID=UPI00352C69BF